MQFYLAVNSGPLSVNALTLANGNGGALVGGGGAIINSGPHVVNVTNSTFSGNQGGTGLSANGGAINNSGTLNVTNSTFFNNSTSGSFNGGAIFTIGTVNVTNSTFSGNSAGGSGGGIYNQNGTATLKNTIIANSTSGGDCFNNGGTLTANSFNIDSDGSCDSATQTTTAAIALSALADNGGPTYTMAIDATSAAFNAGDNTVCAAAPVNNLDQTGVARPRGLICDVGAYEYVYLGFQTGPNFVVNSSADTDDRSCDLLGQGIGNQDCTLREAIAFANANANASTITFNIPATDAGCSAANTCIITLGDNLPHIQEQVTIDGAPNNGHITVDGVNTYQIFWAEANTTLNALTVTRGSGLLSSGGLYSINSTTTVTNSTFDHNLAASGGHIKNDGGTLTIVNSTFSDAPNNGIGNLGGGTLFIYNSTINGNNQPGSGGISNISGTTTLYNTIVVNHENNDCAVTSGTLSADSYNLDEDGTCDNATQKTSAEINLQPLGDNGGPTRTMALGALSSAIDAGNDTVCAASPVNKRDQRNYIRPAGIHCDVGAYEANATTAVNVTGVKARVNLKGNAVIKWRTTSESQIAGFNVYRRTKTGEWKQINAQFKQAKHAGSVEGARYRFADKNVKAGKTYRYKIEVKYLDNHSEWTESVRVRVP